MTQMTLDTPRAHARTTDPSTSHAAAASVTNLRDSQRAVLVVLEGLGPMADDLLVKAYDASRLLKRLPRQSESGIRTRRRELVDRGFVRDSGRRERMASGRQAIVWEAV